ncbi:MULTISPECIES: DUF4827 family protein [Proteiniphilum]|jgi:hypothetical protein|uniref:DUF4827 family protein n=1 Tax=Proteiniphilum TaxID=294702 RepID=UPI001EEAF0D7|nr:MULTISPECIES: DUF4827 family protein [Proteiniphilum]ULB35603.1 DUF4827 family protein [Proteiniphilum propionicum]
MKKINIIPFLLIGLLILIISCNDRKSYADYLKDESRAINLFIAKNNFAILDKFPENGNFEEKEFYKDPNTGVYFNIISYGDTTDSKQWRVQWREKVFIRFKGLQYFMSNDTIRYSNSQSTFPEELEFLGPVTSSNKNSYGTPAWAVPLLYIGHNGKVKMIVPFEVGSSYDRSQYQPTYYDEVSYRFENHINK